MVAHAIDMFTSWLSRNCDILSKIINPDVIEGIQRCVRNNIITDNIILLFMQGIIVWKIFINTQRRSNALIWYAFIRNFLSVLYTLHSSKANEETDAGSN